MGTAGDAPSLEVRAINERLDNAREELESVANMLRGMTLDPAIPAHAKEAMHHRIAHIEGLFHDPSDDFEDDDDEPGED